MATKMRAGNARQYNSIYDPIAVEETCSLMDSTGLDANLCVRIPTSVLTDRNLSIGAKGLYSVLCSIDAQTDEITVLTTMRLSNIGSLEAFYKYRYELILAGYLDSETKRPYSYEVCGSANDSAKTRVLMDQYLTIRLKGIYAYLQCVPGEVPPVKELAVLLGVTQMSIYRAYHMLALFSEKVPMKWRTKCIALQQEAYNDYAEKKPNNFLSSYILNYCQFQDNVPTIFDAGSYRPLNDILKDASPEEKAYIQGTIRNQAFSVSDLELREQLLHVADTVYQIH